MFYFLRWQTELVVYPAAGLLRYYSGDRLIIINRDPTPFDDEAAVVLHGDIAALLPKILPAG